MIITNQYLIFVDTSVILFSCVYGFVSVFLIFRVKNLKKVALPFTISLFIYFILDLIGNIAEYISYRGTGLEKVQDPAQIQLLGNLFIFGGFIVLIGPIYLIFILEKTFFKRPLIKEKHIISVLEALLIFFLISFIIFLITFLSNAPQSQLENLVLFFIVIYAGIAILQVSFFCGGFLYLSLKSTGTYRKNTFLISIGYLSQFIVNLYNSTIILELGSKNPPQTIEFYSFAIGIVFLLKLIAVIIMAYGLLNLYYKREKK